MVHPDIVLFYSIVFKKVSHREGLRSMPFFREMCQNGILSFDLSPVLRELHTI